MGCIIGAPSPRTVANPLRITAISTLFHRRQVLCNTNDWIADALAAKALIRQLDPLGQRVVSANQNGDSFVTFARWR